MKKSTLILFGLVFLAIYASPVNQETCGQIMTACTKLGDLVGDMYKAAELMDEILESDGEYITKNGYTMPVPDGQEDTIKVKYYALWDSTMAILLSMPHQ